MPGGVPGCLGSPAAPQEGSPGAPRAEEVFLRSCVRTLIRLGFQAPAQPGRRRVRGGVPECPGRPPKGSPGGSGSGGGFSAELCPHANSLGFIGPGSAWSPQGARWCPGMPREAPGPPGPRGAPGAEEVFLRSCVRMLIRLGLQAPCQPGRRRVQGGVPKCPGRPRGGLWGAPGAEEVFLRSCVRMLNRLGLQAPAQPGRR